jgi:hypothetical protein
MNIFLNSVIPEKSFKTKFKKHSNNVKTLREQELFSSKFLDFFRIPDFVATLKKYAKYVLFYAENIVFNSSSFSCKCEEVSCYSATTEKGRDFEKAGKHC